MSTPEDIFKQASTNLATQDNLNSVYILRLIHLLAHSAVLHCYIPITTSILCLSTDLISSGYGKRIAV